MPDIIILTETWLNDTSAITCHIEGYSKPYFTHRSVNGGRGGGVMIFCRSGLESLKVENMSLCNESVESCCISVKYLNIYYTVIAIYRPHSGTTQSFTNELTALVSNESMENKNIILSGDFNIDLLKECSDTDIFMTTLQSLHYLPRITKPTRYPPDSSNALPSLLDHIWINFTNINTCGIILADITDHLPTFIMVPVAKHDYDFKKITFRDHSPRNKDSFKTKLKSKYLTFPENNGNISIDQITDQLNSLYCECFPLKTKFISFKRLNKPWLTSSVLKTIRDKSSYFKLSKMGIISEEEYKIFRNRHNYLIRDLKRKHFSNEFKKAQGNVKKSWKLIKSIINKNLSNKTIKSICVDGSVVSEEDEIAESFNNYFSNVASNLDSTIPKSDISPIDYLAPNLLSSLYMYPLTVCECSKIISNLKNTNYGPDRIPTRILKSVSNEITPVLCKSINTCITTGVFPDSLKVACITPIHKGGDTKDIANYRPISVLPLLSKIFESCIYNRLYDYLCKMSIISPNQYGFQRKKSTSDAMIDLTESIYSALNLKQHSVCIMVDFRKAFDTVNHEILLGKLQRYGVRGIALDLLRNYLHNRKQLVRIGKKVSSIKTINIGIPQGSILGPLLFLIYINDMPLASKFFKSVLYADDTTLIANGSNLNALIPQINQNLTSMKHWITANRLSLNVSKTFAMIFSHCTYNEPPSILFDGQVVTYKSTGKFLGVIFDDKLRFNEHIKHVSLKISKSIGILYRIRPLIPRDILINLYYNFVFPYLIYGNLIWSGTSATYLQKLILLQKRVIRIITKSNYLAHSTPLFYSTQILKLPDIYKYFLALHSFKLIQSNNYAQTNQIYNFRNQNIPVMFHRLTSTQKAVSFMSPSYYNSLPRQLRDTQPLSTFKKILKEYLLLKYIV